jgi:hypothetical protein
VARLLPASQQVSIRSTPLLVPLHKFPFESIGKPLKQMPIVQTHHRFAGLDIERDPAPLRSRILHDFNSTHENDSYDSAGGE